MAKQLQAAEYEYSENKQSFQERREIIESLAAFATARGGVRVIEQWGTGTLRIVEACEAQGMPRPEFTSEMDTFKVRFQGVAERLFLDLAGLSDNQRRAVAHVQEHGQITTQEYAHLVRVGERTARRHLAAMAEQGIFQFRDAGPKSHYALHPSHKITRSSKMSG